MNGLELELVPGYQHGVTNRTPEFLAKFPLGKVPAFESADGSLLLTEGHAIARYVAESGPRAAQLVGADAATRALVEQWACFSEQELAANLIPPLLMCLLKVVPFDQARYDQCLGALERALKRLDLALQGGRKFLVGEQITLADVMVAGVLVPLARNLMDSEMRKGVPHVEAYLKAVMEVPEMKQAFGTVEFCETRVKA
jgi:elongation factor 1-gamma